MREAEIENPVGAVDFVSKMICYRKNWQQNVSINMNGNAVERPGVQDFTADYEPRTLFDPQRN